MEFYASSSLRKGHGSYLAAVKNLVSCLKPVASQTPLALEDERVIRYVTAIIEHLIREPYCRECGLGNELDVEEVELWGIVGIEAVGIGGPAVLVGGTDGGDDIIMQNPLKEIADFLSDRRVRVSGQRLRRTTACLNTPRKEF